MRSMPHTVQICRTVAAEVARCIGAGRPSAGGRRTAAARHRLMQHRRGLSVLRRPAHCRFGSEEGSTLVLLQTLSSLKQTVNTTNTQPGISSVMPRSCISLALRGTAAPGCSGRAGTGFARAGGVGALGHGITQREIQTGPAVSSPARSNPSVKRTHNGGARLLASPASAAPLCAAYLKR